MLDLKKENSLFASGLTLVAGVDEAGRGPLAGPVVAAAVTLKPEMVEKFFAVKELKTIRDSKLVPEKKREELFEIIKDNFFEVGVGVCDHETIDRINIYQATFLAMKKAIGALKTKPDYIMLDGRAPIPNLSLRQENIINGDAFVLSIAAASIIAKVTHDRLIAELAVQYPQYGFLNHKGYGTKEHLEALKKYGPTPFHRQTFGPVKKLLKKLT
ncbi:MAG: ribonuclease HII [Patescibacteria group bacterium]|nr:ribonuclease HII [Patescibacteria group bacterium]